MKKRKELKEFRTATSKRFLNLDGTIQVELFKEPVHFLNENGLYEEINNTLEETPYGVRNKRSDFKVDFNYKNNDNFLEISLNNKKIKMFPKNMNFEKNSKILKKDKISRNVDKIKFEKIQKDTDIEYEIRSKCLKESIILKEKPETNIIDFVIQTDLSLQLNDDNSIDLFDNKKKVFKIEKPYMIDKNKAYSENIKYEIFKNNLEYELKIILDNDWINDKDRTYPVIIDPTVTGIEDTNSVEDTYIFNGDESTTTYNLNKLLVGTDENNVSYRTLLKFNLPVIPTGYRMVNADLYLYSIPKYGSKVLNDKKISIYRINKNWNESTAKWNDMNSSFDNKIYDYSISSNSIYYAENDEIKIDWGGTGANVTQLVQEWYNNPSNNYGMMLKWYDETYSSANEVCEFISSEYLEDSDINGVKPLLSITYKNFNRIETYLACSTQKHHFGTVSVNYYTGNLTAVFNVGNTIGGILPVEFYLVYNTNDVISNRDYGYGLGVKPNLIQTLEKELIQVNNNEDDSSIIYDIIKHLDEDGTIHYFYKQEDGSYIDEDGLGLTISLSENDYIMTDKDGNTNKYVAHGNTYYLEEIKDTSNKTIRISYDSNNKINSVIDGTNHSLLIEYEDGKITIISPHKETIINLTNNLITSITSLEETETITYTEDKLIEKITNPNGLAIKYEYLNDISFKIYKVSEISKNNNIGNYLIYEYNLTDTKVTDNKGRFNTYIFNSYGNVVGITCIDKENNLSKAYSQSFAFGNDEGSINKLTLEKSLIQYVNNLIEDSSFEGNESMRFINGDINSTNTTSSAYSKSGLKSLSVDIPRGGGYIYKDFSLEKGKSYTFSFFIKGASLTENVEELCVDVILSYDDERKTVHVNQLTNEFVRYSVTIEYIEEAIENLRITFQNVNAEPVSFFIDDVQLEEGEVANYYNLITNSNFKDGTNTWNIDVSNSNENGIVGNATAEVVTIADNNKALKIYSTPLDSIALTKTFNISGKAGDTFNLSFWYKNEGIIPSGYIGLNAGIWANVFFHYGDDYLDGAGIPVENLNVGSNNWQFLSQNFTAEADYENITLQILSIDNANNCYLTNFSLFKDLEQYSYEYDENGNLVSTTYLNSNRSQLCYNNNNQLIIESTPEGNDCYFEYDKKITNRLIQSTMKNGISSEIVYDSNNNPTKMIINNKRILEPLNTTNSYYIRAKGTNKYLYINDDKSIKVKACSCSHDKFRIINSDNYYKIYNAILTDYYLKEENNLLKLDYGDDDNTFEIISNDNGSYSIKQTSSNKAFCIIDNDNVGLSEYSIGNINQEFYFENASSKLVIENKNEYSSDGRFITKVIDSTNNETIYNINEITGQLISLINSKGETINYTYNNKNKITKIESNNHSVSYEYDNGNLSNIIHGTNNYSINYDEYNNIKNIKINNTIIESNYFENNNGNLLYKKYGNNDEIHYEYDSFDRLNIVKKEDNDFTNYYDNLGRIVKIKNNNDEYNYEYDFANRLSNYKTADFEIEYNYDTNNRVNNKIEKFENNTYNYDIEYDNSSFFKKMTFDNNNYNCNYDELGRLSEENINDIIITKYNYLTYGNKTSNLINRVEYNSDIYEYNYDELNNIISIKNNNNIKKIYSYDEHSQLVKEDSFDTNEKIEYTYDNNGNILSKKIYNYETNELLNQYLYEYEDENWSDLLTKCNEENITYDEIGNPLSIGEKNLNWKNGKELASYISNNNNIKFNYNENGIRISKIINDSEIKYFIEDNKILFEKRNEFMLHYIYADDELIGFNYNNNIYYYQKNFLDDIIGVIDSNYNEIVRYTYDGYGNITSIEDNSGINLGIINPYRFRSYYFDIETELYYVNTRYYNPKWGRFLNADSSLGSSENLISYNLFQYCFNNPIMYTDGDGEWPKWLKKASKKIAAGLVIAAATAAVVAISTASLGVGVSVLAAGIKTGAAIGAISAATSATISVGNSVLKSENIETATKKATQAAVEGFADGFLAGTISNTISKTGLIRGNGTKIGKTDKKNYGRITLWYGDKKSGTLINVADKSGKSKFRVDFDDINGAHLHFKTDTNGMSKHNSKAYNESIGIIAGIINALKNLW